jgi:hypothetical protein
MTNRYYCPHCQGLLNPGTKVIFVIERGSERGLILLSPELGDYAVVLAEAISIEPGVLHRLYCPVCHGDLTSSVNGNLVEILCREPDGSQSRVNFSRVGGEHATFVRGPGGVQSYGEHAERYATVNFFGVGKNGGLDGA